MNGLLKLRTTIIATSLTRMHRLPKSLYKRTELINNLDHTHPQSQQTRKKLHKLGTSLVHVPTKQCKAKTTAPTWLVNLKVPTTQYPVSSPSQHCRLSHTVGQQLQHFWQQHTLLHRCRHHQLARYVRHLAGAGPHGEPAYMAAKSLTVDGVKGRKKFWPVAGSAYVRQG